eukprot:5159879-Prymnesium_polylepis.1
MVYLFAFPEHPDGARAPFVHATGPDIVVRTQLKQLQDYWQPRLDGCNEEAYERRDGDRPPPFGGITQNEPGYTACDRQGGWWMMANTSASIRASVANWSTATSRGQITRERQSGGKESGWRERGSERG